MKFDAEKLKDIWQKVKTAIGKVSKKIWIAVAAAVVVIAVGIAIFMVTRPYSILITGADAATVTSTVQWLEGRGITNYRYQGSDTILVPERQAVALKAQLLQETYQDGTPSFSGYFENLSMLSTERDRRNVWSIAVMDYLGDVIKAMDGVQDATVAIAEGEDRTYVLDSGNVREATASVTVTMQSGRTLTDQMAAAIRGLVSHGVQGLTVDSVFITDNYGRQYNAGSVNGSSDTTALKLQVEEAYENKLRTAATQILLPYCGAGHVNVSVNVVVEVGDSTSFTHAPSIPEYVDNRSEGKGIIGSWVQTWGYNATDEVIAGGIVGTSSNSDVLSNVEREPNEGDVEGQIEGSSQHDYDNPYTDTETTRTAAYITDCTVAVSLDSTTVGTPNVEELRRLVANAVGISPVVTETMTADEYLASKITIHVAPFYQPNTILPGGSWWPFEDIVPSWMVLAALAGLLLFIIVLVVILALRSKSKKKKRLQEEEELQRQQSMDELLAAVGVPQLEPVGADVMSLQTEKSMELRQDIRQFAEENPEVAAQLIRNWLRGGDDNG